MNAIALAVAGSALFAAGVISGCAITAVLWRRLVDAVRDSRDEWRDLARSTHAAHTSLVEQMIRLKRKNYELPSTARVAAPPDPEQQALRQVEEQFTQKVRERRAAADREFVDTAVQHLVGEGLSLDAAKREAARLRGEVTDMHPAGG